jgi:hypothetical protein
MSRMFRHCWPSRPVELVLVFGGCALASGCASLGPKPWQHDLMARPAMSVSAYHLHTAVDEHIYFSKEASSGGRSYAGGGCGCN